MNIHTLKSIPPYYEEVEDYTKPFEIRKDDRNYKVGDILILREWLEEPGLIDGHYTGRFVVKSVTYICTYAQQEGYVVMAIQDPSQRVMRDIYDGIIEANNEIKRKEKA